VRLSETPAYIGGQINRGAPCYGEDNEWVLGELLGMSKAEMARLADEDVI
jgi:crotonobetainyl-CoA:carnitine CoA-transferase CaiB-like acyl-CoA transferase